MMEREGRSGGSAVIAVVLRKYIGEPDLDRIEMLQRVPPGGELLRRIASMTFIRDHEIERMNRDVEPIRVVVIIVSSAKHPVSSIKIDGHPLDRADVDEGMPPLRIGKVVLRQELRIASLPPDRARVFHCRADRAAFDSRVFTSSSNSTLCANGPAGSSRASIDQSDGSQGTSRASADLHR